MHSTTSRKALRYVAPLVSYPISSGILFFSLFFALQPSARGAGTSEPPAAASVTDEQQMEWITRQVLKDMMYGTDDFFGEDSDLAMADSVVPTAAQSPDTTTDTSPATSPDHDHPDDKPPPDVEPPPDEEPPPV